MTGTKPSLIVVWLSGRDRVSPWPRRATRTFRRARPAGPVAGAQEACHRPAPHCQLAPSPVRSRAPPSARTRARASTGLVRTSSDDRSIGPCPHQVVPGGRGV